MTVTFRRLVTALALLLATANGARADFYTPDWTRTGFFGPRDFAAEVLVTSQNFPVVAGVQGPIYGTAPSGSGSQVAMAARFSPAGVQQWTSPAYPTLQLDHVLGADIDQSDNLYIGGETYRYGSEAFLVKYNNSGVVQWERHLGSPDNEFGRDVAVDAVGNAYLLGSTTGVLTGGTHTGYDAFIAKYSPSGSLLLLKQYTDTSVSDIPSAIDVQGNSIYVVGTQGAMASKLTRLDAAGNVTWSITLNYASLPVFGTQLYNLVVDPTGNIYTCGFTDTVYDNGTGFHGSDAVIGKHAPDGALLWTRRLNTGENDSLNAIHLDAFGDVYVAGSRTSSEAIIAGDSDAIWAKLNPQGDLLWQQIYETPESEGASGIVADAGRNVYLSGARTRNANGYYAGDSDAFLLRYNFAVPEPAAAAPLLAIASAIPSVRRQRARRCAPIN